MPRAKREAKKKRLVKRQKGQEEIGAPVSSSWLLASLEAIGRPVSSSEPLASLEAIGGPVSPLSLPTVEQVFSSEPLASPEEIV